MLKVAIMLLSPPKYFISIEIEISAIVLADAQKKQEMQNLGTISDHYLCQRYHYGRIPKTLFKNYEAYNSKRQ